MRTSWTCLALSLSLAVVACKQDPSTEVVVEQESDAAKDAVSETGDAGEWDGDESDATDEARESSATSPEPVTVGLEPTARSEQDGGTASSAQLDAVLLSMATGARGLTATSRWAELEGDGTSDGWKKLESLTSLVRSQKRMLLLTIPVVDATLDGRPGPLQATGWDAEATRLSIRALIDRLFSKVGPELRYLSLGLEVDRFVQANAGQREAFLTFATQTVQYANTHINRPQSMQAAVTWSHKAWLAADTPASWAPELLDQSDIVMIAYTPMGDDLRARAADSVHGDLPTMLAAAGDRPLVFASVSYPSSLLIGGSDDAQAHFFDLLFLEVEMRRARLPFVAVSSLHDPEPESCLGRAAAMGQPGSAELYAYWCSTGLRTRDGVAKKAFDSFRSGAAELLEP